MNLPPYSVLMSVYAKENPSFLSEALKSIWAQSIQTDDFVLICDGPLTENLDAVISENQVAHQNVMRVIRLPQNQGLGNALKLGVIECENELIMRADSDDISHPNRAQTQLAKLVGEKLDIISSTVSLFCTDPSDPIGERRVPLTQDAIIAFSKKRSPFNHPAVTFRKSSVIRAGNYDPSMRFRQDYFLWIKMLQSGSIGANLEEALVSMRNDSSLVKRRKNKVAYQCALFIISYMRKSHYISFVRFILNRLAFSFQYHAPNWLLSCVYRFILHRKHQKMSKEG